MKLFDRREVLRGLGLGLAAVPVLGACGANFTGSADAPRSDGSGNGDALSGSGWASGGTVSMTDKASYPDPFSSALGACALVATTTEGPCNTATDLDREDVSEGWTGIPVRLALKVVNTACAPIVGAVVKIWHTNIGGTYSGQTPNNTFCLKDQAYASMDFMRGVRTTDGNGIVYFDTCFPGWYPGRAIHIHFQIKVGGTSTRISQLFFPEGITTNIFAAHPEYIPYGQPDTVFSSDGVIAGIPAASRVRHMFDVARMSDGAMLASKVVTVS